MWRVNRVQHLLAKDTFFRHDWSLINLQYLKLTVCCQAKLGFFHTNTCHCFPFSFWDLKGLYPYQFGIVNNTDPRANWQTIPKIKDDEQSLSIIPDAKYTFNFSIIDNMCKYYAHLLLGKEI